MTTMTVRHFTNKDATYYQYADRQIFVGDVLDSSNSGTTSVGFYRNLRKGERNEWVVSYDEALIVTKGALTVRFAEGAKTAKVGEVIFSVAHVCRCDAGSCADRGRLPESLSRRGRAERHTTLSQRWRS